MDNISLITPEREAVLLEIFKGIVSRKAHPELTALTRAELNWITPRWGRTLLVELVRHGFGSNIAPLLTDGDFLSRFLHPGTTILHHLARNPFPNQYFPHHLLTPELMEPSGSGVGVFTRLVEAARNNPGEIVENLPVFHIDSKWLTPHLLFQEDGDGMGITNLEALLGCGERGRALVMRMPKPQRGPLSSA